MSIIKNTLKFFWTMVSFEKLPPPDPNYDMDEHENFFVMLFSSEELPPPDSHYDK